MKTQLEPEVSVLTAPPKHRIGRILRWAARLTSVPVFVLAMSSLLPALASFSISAKDDKIIAVGLCGVCLGLGLGWAWASLGGAMVLAAVALLLAQEGTFLYPDPFSIAFGLQGILFLISGLLHSTPRPGTSNSATLRWVRPTAVAILTLCAAAGAFLICRGPGPSPLTKDKASFLGMWQSEAGFAIEITPEGYAKVTQRKSAKVDPPNKALPPVATGTFLASFQGDEKLELSSGPLGISKIYHVDRAPHAEGNQIKMSLNDSDPYNRNSAMVLVKERAKAP